MGTAVGDALGAPVEGHPHIPRHYLESLVDDPQNLTYTDDTVMTLGVAESLVACGRFEGEKASVDLLTVLDPPPLYQAGTFAAGATPSSTVQAERPYSWIPG